MLVIILPNEIDGLQKIESNLEKINFNYEDAKNSYKPEIILELPKFKIESTIELNPHLQEVSKIMLKLYYQGALYLFIEAYWLKNLFGRIDHNRPIYFLLILVMLKVKDL